MEWLQLFISLLGIIGLIFFLFYLMKKVNKNASFVGGNKLRIIDRATLGRDSALVVVSVCGKLMLIGVSAGQTEKICDLPLTESEYLKSAAGADLVNANALNFSDILANIGLKSKKKTITEGESCTNEDATDCGKE